MIWPTVGLLFSPKQCCSGCLAILLAVLYYQTTESAPLLDEGEDFSFFLRQLLYQHYVRQSVKVEVRVFAYV